MPPYVIYARKSSESEDRQVLSIESQVRELQTLASRRGLQVGEVLTETKSAKAPRARPVFGQLMRRVGRGQIRGIVCWKMDRLARNHLDTGAILQALADGMLEEVVTSDRTYTRDGNDRFMGNFELGMATKYIDDLRQNVRRGNRARLERGWINHTPPLGYLLDPVSKTIVKDPERFDLVRRIWELTLTGSMRPTQILRIANEEWGLRTRKFKRVGGNPLSRSALFRILGHPFYMGEIRLRTGEVYVGAHPPMVTREEFQRVQEVLGRPGRPRPKRHTFPFTGLIRCGRCDGGVTAEEHVKPSGRRYVYYHCSRRKKGVTCREPAIPQRDLEAQILLRLRWLKMPTLVLDWLKRRVTKELGREVERAQAVRATIEKALQGVKREGENLLSLRLRDQVSDEDFAKRKQLIEGRQRALEERLQHPTHDRDAVPELARATFDFASRTAEVFRSGTPVQRRLILDAVGSNYMLRGRKVLFDFKKPFCILADAGARCNWWACGDDVRHWLLNTTEYFALPDLPSAASTASLPSGPSHEGG